MNTLRHPIWLSLLLGLSAPGLASCGDQPAPTAAVEPAVPADFERFARMPCPIASLASSGISFFSSDLAVSCSR